jgi:hypothetical protein
VTGAARVGFTSAGKELLCAAKVCNCLSSQEGLRAFLHNLRAEFGEMTLAGEISKGGLCVDAPISSFAAVVEAVNASVR